MNLILGELYKNYDSLKSRLELGKMYSLDTNFGGLHTLNLVGIFVGKTRFGTYQFLIGGIGMRYLLEHEFTVYVSYNQTLD